MECGRSRSPADFPAGSSKGTPERRRLDFSARADSESGLRCKGKMPAEDAYGPVGSGKGPAPGRSAAVHGSGRAFAHPQGARGLAAGAGPTLDRRSQSARPQGAARGEASSESVLPKCLEGVSGGADRSSGESPGFLDGRKRKLEDELGHVSRLRESLNDFICRGKRRDGAGGSSGADCCAEASMEGGSRSNTRERRLTGEDAMEDILEAIARAGDARLSSEARARTDAAGPPTSRSGGGGTPCMTAASSSSGSSHAANPEPDAQVSDEFVGGEPPRDPHHFQISHWRRSLVRRVSSGPVEEGERQSGAGARSGGGAGHATSRDGVGLVWRVQVSGSCSGLPFTMSFVVNQQVSAFLKAIPRPPAGET